MELDRDRDRSRGRGITGVVLVALGAIFLMMNFGVWHYGRVGQLWPLIFFVIALGQLAAPTPKRVGSAVFMIMLGLWFFGCMHEWRGMSYVNSWPLLLVGSGLDMVLSGMLEHFLRLRHEAAGGGPDHV